MARFFTKKGKVALLDMAAQVAQPPTPVLHIPGQPVIEVDQIITTTPFNGRTTVAALVKNTGKPPFGLPPMADTIDIDTYVDQLDVTTYGGAKTFVPGMVQGSVTAKYSIHALELHVKQMEALVDAYQKLMQSFDVRGNEYKLTSSVAMHSFTTKFNEFFDCDPLGAVVTTQTFAPPKTVYVDEVVIDVQEDPEPVVKKPKIIKKQPKRGDNE